MHSLIGERFLKRFFGIRFQWDRTNSVGEVSASPENEGKFTSAEKPAESSCPPSEDLPRKNALWEIAKTGETNQIQNTHE